MEPINDRSSDEKIKVKVKRFTKAVTGTKSAAILVKRRRSISNTRLNTVKSPYSGGGGGGGANDSISRSASLASQGSDVVKKYYKVTGQKVIKEVRRQKSLVKKPRRPQSMQQQGQGHEPNVMMDFGGNVEVGTGAGAGVSTTSLTPTTTPKSSISTTNSLPPPTSLSLSSFNNNNSEHESYSTSVSVQNNEQSSSKKDTITTTTTLVGPLTPPPSPDAPPPPSSLIDHQATVFVAPLTPPPSPKPPLSLQVLNWQEAASDKTNLPELSPSTATPPPPPPPPKPTVNQLLGPPPKKTDQLTYKSVPIGGATQIRARHNQPHSSSIPGIHFGTYSSLINRDENGSVDSISIQLVILVAILVVFFIFIGLMS